MNESSSVKLLDFAIGKEQEAHDFYIGLANTMASDSMKEVFRGFALEEAAHKARLEAIKSGKISAGALRPVINLMIGDYLAGGEPQPDMTYQQALVIAMNREKAAFRLYTDMAAEADGEVRETLLHLAQEEAKHKLRFEIEYDEVVLKEN